MFILTQLKGLFSFLINSLHYGHFLRQGSLSVLWKIDVECREEMGAL